MNPKIFDFGMARIFKQNETEAMTKRVVDTHSFKTNVQWLHVSRVCNVRDFLGEIRCFQFWSLDP
ncbi:putative non-specific serine/threonine protein kinase [Helianthus anomalus]